jgi:hypothetical protein
MDVQLATYAAASRVAPGIDSVRAGAINAYHHAVNKLRKQLATIPMSPQGHRATEAMVRLYETRIDALSREFAAPQSVPR